MARESVPSIAQRPSPGLPLVAIVGRPNVGKSTLFNRITGTRRAIVGDEPGITRDRIHGRAAWNGKPFEIVDTGGMLPGDRDLIPREIFKHAQVAVSQAAQVVMVVDGRAEITGTDRELAQLLRRTGRPLRLAVNKVDSPKQDADAHRWHELGIEPVHFISAEHGGGVADMLDRIVDEIADAAPVAQASEESAETREISVAIIGKPNVGKSTLLNRIAGEERSIVTPIAGTTRDAVDLLVDSPIAGRLRVVDTAGIRKKTKTHLMAEKLSVVMAERHVRLCDVALLMMDATEGATSLDATIAGYAHNHGKGIILVMNKWDLAPNKLTRAGELTESIRMEMPFLSYAPVQFLSAADGWNVEKLLRNIREVERARGQRIPTSELNKFFEKLNLERAPVPMQKRMKIFYITQAGVRPPTFIGFTDKAARLHPALERYLENQLRRRFGFTGTPIVIKTRGREQRAPSARRPASRRR